MKIEAIQERLAEFDTAAVRETLSHAPEPTDGRSRDEVIDGALDWVMSLVCDLTMLCEQVGSGEDLQMTLAVQYVELKSRWIAFNTKINYAVFRTGSPDVADMCRAAAVSGLLAHIEVLLDPADIDHITEFLAKPLSEAA